MSFPTESAINPFLFLVGCPRSGTTLLRRILDAHPDLAMLESEQHWLVRYYVRKKRLTQEGNLTPEFIDALFAHEKFLKLKINRIELETILWNYESISYSQFISLLFDLYGRMHGKSLVGDKTPENAHHIPLLSGLWPHAKFVHLIRDGRNVALSAMAWEKNEKLKRDFTMWNDDPVATSALWWASCVRAARSAGRILGPDRYYEIHYEPLVANPEQEIRKLCNFFGIPDSNSMIHFYAGKNQKGKDAKHAWLPITPGLRNWQIEMPAADQERFEKSAGDLLEELGYTRNDSGVTTKC
jgi:hypothetical protein